MRKFKNLGGADLVCFISTDKPSWKICAQHDYELILVESLYNKTQASQKPFGGGSYFLKKVGDLRYILEAGSLIACQSLLSRGHSIVSIINCALLTLLLLRFLFTRLHLDWPATHVFVKWLNRLITLQRLKIYRNIIKMTYLLFLVIVKRKSISKQ